MTLNYSALKVARPFLAASLLVGQAPNFAQELKMPPPAPLTTFTKETPQKEDPPTPEQLAEIVKDLDHKYDVPQKKNEKFGPRTLAQQSLNRALLPYAERSLFECLKDPKDLAFLAQIDSLIKEVRNETLPAEVRKRFKSAFPPSQGLNHSFVMTNRIGMPVVQWDSKHIQKILNERLKIPDLAALEKSLFPAYEVRLELARNIMQASGSVVHLIRTGSDRTSSEKLDPGMSTLENHLKHLVSTKVIKSYKQSLSVTNTQLFELTIADQPSALQILVDTDGLKIKIDVKEDTFSLADLFPLSALDAIDIYGLDLCKKKIDGDMKIEFYSGFVKTVPRSSMNRQFLQTFFRIEQRGFDLSPTLNQESIISIKIPNLKSEDVDQYVISEFLRAR